MDSRLSKFNSLMSGGTTTTTTSTSAFATANCLLSVAQNGASISTLNSNADGNTLTDANGCTMTWDNKNRMTFSLLSLCVSKERLRDKSNE